MFYFKEQHIFYLVLMAGAGFFLSLANAIPNGIGVSGDPGASFLPTTICILILALVAYLFVKEGLVEGSDKVTKFKRSEMIVLLATFALIFVYVWFLEMAGFISATVVFLFIFQRLTQFIVTVQKPTLKSLFGSLTFAVLSTLGIHLVFSVLFEMSLP